MILDAKVRVAPVGGSRLQRSAGTTAAVLAFGVAFGPSHLSARRQAGPFSVNNSNDIRAVALQADGKILVGGHYMKAPSDDVVAAKGCVYLCRLNPDGSIDQAFKPDLAPRPGVRWLLVSSIVVQPDQKIVIGGVFPVGDGSFYAPGEAQSRRLH